MFKDKGICGQSEMSIDDKNRMILPSYTGADPNEELVIIKNEESNCYDIYNSELYFEKLQNQIKYLEERIKTTESIKMREKLQILLNNIYSRILAKTKCDKQKRIVITPILEENEKIDKIKTIGAYDHLMLRKK